MKVGSDFIPVNQNNKTFYSFEKVNTDIIENIQTKEYLIALNSNFINLHEINNPKSIKLGKDRMLMYKHLSNITNPEFINASHSLRDIYAAKSLWNEELLQLDKEYKKVSDLETPSREQQ